MGYNKGASTCAQVSKPAKCPSWPFGTYYFAADIGSCVYGLTAALGWNSSQFSVMSTGGGGSKACDYPNYDYEIVYVGGSDLKNRVCKNSVKIDDKYIDDIYGFKLLDISGQNKSLLDYYIKENYVQGSTTGLSKNINDLIACIGNNDQPNWASQDRVNAFESLFGTFQQRYTEDTKRYSQTPFSSCIMPLNEMNVHTDLWGNNRPNSLFYNEPQGKCNPVSGDSPEDRNKSLQQYLECENKGGTASSWPFGIEKSGASDCPYKDGDSGMRAESIRNKVNQLWSYNIPIH
jgi:hypothetical protein